MQIKTDNFHLRHCLESGQCFAWEPYKKGYGGVIQDIFYYLYQEGNTIHVHPYQHQQPITDKKLLQRVKKELLHYFSLNAEYEKILTTIDKDPYIHDAIIQYLGIRLIKQPHFDCFISFMLSANTTVNNAKQARTLLSQKFGSLVYRDEESQKSFYSLPDLQTFQTLSEHDLRTCKTGFRAAYIAKAVQELTPQFFYDIEHISYENAKTTLMRIKGIGEKIADCILVYSYDFDNVYPTDTWVQQFTRKLYMHEHKVNEKHIRAFGMEYFAPYAGWAQLFLYIYFRESKAKM